MAKKGECLAHKKLGKLARNKFLCWYLFLGLNLIND